jgi:hypothetical protein
MQKLNYYEGRNCVMEIALLNSQTDDEVYSMAESVGHRLLCKQKPSSQRGKGAPKWDHQR